MNDREHPQELLAEYVDSTLGAEDRARVETHLADCPQCREEVDLAGDGRAAMATLTEEPAPAGLEFAVRRRYRSPSPRVWAMAGAAAAAAGILVAAILYFGPAEEQAATTGAGGQAGESLEESDENQGLAPVDKPGAEALAAPGIPRLQTVDTDYTPASLLELGRRLRDRARTAADVGFTASARRYFEQTDLDEFPPPVRAAVACALQEVPPEQLLVPFLVQKASFEGEPAYVTAFLQGPSPDADYDRVLIWVVDQRTCSLRYYASQRL
jgi:hypothetical protein